MKEEIPYMCIWWLMESSSMGIVIIADKTNKIIFNHEELLNHYLTACENFLQQEWECAESMKREVYSILTKNHFS